MRFGGAPALLNCHDVRQVPRLMMTGRGHAAELTTDSRAWIFLGHDVGSEAIPQSIAGNTFDENELMPSAKSAGHDNARFGDVQGRRKRRAESEVRFALGRGGRDACLECTAGRNRERGSPGAWCDREVKLPGGRVRRTTQGAV